MAIQFRDRTIDDFKGRLVGGGARSNLFEVELPLIEGAATDNKSVEDLMRFMIKATSLPSSTVSAVSVPVRGRQLHVAGDRTFDDWSVTVINDTNFSIRSSLEKWMNLMNKHEDASGLINPVDYQKNATVYQLGRGSNTTTAATDAIPVLRQYKFYGIWPTAIDSIALDYGADNQIQEFYVTFKVHWWEALLPGGASDLA